MQQTKDQPGRFQSAHWCAAAGSGSGSAREASAGNDAEEPTGDCYLSTMYIMVAHKCRQVPWKSSGTGPAYGP